MGDVTDNINNNLKGLFDTTDDFYRVFICDDTGVIPATINKPTDIDIGAIASEQEYLRRVSLGLGNQIFINRATGEFLKFTLEKFFSSVRLSGETEAQWAARVAVKVFSPKVSHASLIVALRPYSSLEPNISSGLGSGAFAGLSYASRYKKFTDAATLVIVYPAIARSFSFALFFVTIELFDTEFGDISTVLALIESILAAGISYELIITVTP